MTIQQFKNDFLDSWLKERNLTIRMQKEGLFTNILEELGELSEGIRAKDEELIVDSLLDMLVFSLNAYEYNEVVTALSSIKKFDFFNKDIELLKVASIKACRIATSSKINYDTLQNFKEYISCIKEYIERKNLDFELCLDEVAKVLSSRKGRYDEKIKKFVKDTSFPIYEPNYSLNCYKSK